MENAFESVALAALAELNAMSDDTLVASVLSSKTEPLTLIFEEIAKVSNYHEKTLSFSNLEIQELLTDSINKAFELHMSKLESKIDLLISLIVNMQQPYVIQRTQTRFKEISCNVYESNYRQSVMNLNHLAFQYQEPGEVLLTLLESIKE